MQTRTASSALRLKAQSDPVLNAQTGHIQNQAGCVFNVIRNVPECVILLREFVMLVQMDIGDRSVNVNMDANLGFMAQSVALIVIEIVSLLRMGYVDADKRMVNANAFEMLEERVTHSNQISLDFLTFSERSVLSPNNKDGGDGAGADGVVVGGAVGGVVALLIITLVIGRRIKDRNDAPKKDGYKADHTPGRPPDPKDKVRKVSTEQPKTKKLRNTAGNSEHLGNGVNSKPSITDASNNKSQEQNTDDVYHNLNKVATKNLGDFVAAKDRSYYLKQFKTMQDYSVFWRMIWQQNVGKIVMLTNLVEDGKPKCDQYWPDHGITKQYSEINVTCLTEDMYADFVMRTFSVQVDEEDRTVQHLHFTSWPDKGVPDDVTSLVDFRHRVLQTQSPLDGPPIVHCSAGVGRTGTYIAMDLLTREGEAEGSVDIHGCVTNLRHRRTRMVQTADQYAFLHHAIVHTLTLDSKPVPTDGLEAFMSDSENEQRQIKQFKSYKQRNKFVFAMTPLEETVADFLCLTMQETATCILDMEEVSSMYIPDVGTQRTFESYTVDNLRQKSTLYSVNRVLRISYNGRGGPKEQTVSHFKLTAWPDKAEVPESVTHFLHLVKEVETTAASGSVILHCNSGGGRCGLFAAICTLLEKTGIEHEVSVFNTVRQLRARRPNAVRTKEQYAFCHECVCEYLQSFDIYSNFL
ncbi:receptor-type tyrosine-protein phosphatase kappa-like [Mya arenaria]|uniref:receptor-type tyrosine-protein phosphatase kappa-like n=1 Tax=Mya arenaria TaxID=6604 RepID=UPI0022E52BD2|nr:receptor-type tyrosine-protein phosphatase kappa-like [Mya arenaria]